MIKGLFSPPIFDNEEDNFRAKFINGFAWIAILSLSIALILGLSPGPGQHSITTVIFLVGLILVMFLSLYLLRKGNLNASGSIMIVLGWLGLGLQAYATSGARDVIVIAYIAIGLLASIIINWRVGSIIIMLSIGVIWALALLEINGILHPVPQETITFSRDITFIFAAIAVLIYFSTNSLRDAITRAIKSEQRLFASNKDLQELNQTLEERVNERISELNLANQRNERHAKQYEAIAQVARTTISIQNLDTLLRNITRLIGEQFGFYHVGIFLLGDNREFAVLMAANSKGGKKMLAHNYKLKVGQVGIVGYVTSSGNPRIALDTDTDAIHFDNPDLPDTRSELALPLRIAGQIIGALDVQSITPNAFSQDDVKILSTLADQIAIAIQNARSFEESRKLLQEARSTLSSYMTESWQALRPIQKGLGYQFSDNAIKVLERPIEGSHIKDALKKGSVIISGENSNNLAIPIRLRGQVVGVMNLQNPTSQAWDQDQIDIATATAERLSLAIENATLLQATQRRADIERVTSNISARISSSTRYETILQTAAEELSRALGGSDVLVQIEPFSIEMGVTRQ